MAGRAGRRDEPSAAGDDTGFFRRYRTTCLVALGVTVVLGLLGFLLNLTSLTMLGPLLGLVVLGVGVPVTRFRRRRRYPPEERPPPSRTETGRSTGGAVLGTAPPGGSRRTGSGDGIFISYRRQDEAAFAGRLYDRLGARFGSERVFIDVDSIHLGMDFAEVIDTSLRRCRVLLVVIGSRWTNAQNERGRSRLADPHDFVRMEVEKALARPGVLVVPILVDGAVLPDLSELPPSLQPLTRRQALSIANASFGPDSDFLVRTLERILDEPDDGSGGR